ncbi:hypothetical protein ABN028_19445 [Actinopolymorpha sp. B17G11]|uniref:hypothetical protein n=1 Tax=Actinopolymorpha sp. B17G11 TaxID=3160861 RepID=UPI0032E36DF8
MIPAPPGRYVAHYMHPDQDGDRTKPVLAFSDDGDALVLDEMQGRLVPAASAFVRHEFRFVREATGSSRPLVAIAPAGGWMVQYTDKSDGEKWATPLAGWGLTPAGDVVPLETDADGVTSEAGDLGDVTAHFYHPDQVGMGDVPQPKPTGRPRPMQRP